MSLILIFQEDWPLATNIQPKSPAFTDKSIDASPIAITCSSCKSNFSQTYLAGFPDDFLSKLHPPITKSK